MPRRCNENSSDDDPPRKKACMSSFDLKPDEYLRDLTGKQWKLGKAVGVGGFGEIYLASDNLAKEVKTDSLYVAKVESHKNGPLFVEVNCYLRIAKASMKVSVEEWKSKKKMSALGMPHYVASGSHVHKGERYRFLILPKFDRDLEKVLQDKKTLNLKTVLAISSQIMDVLEYIHGKGYIHSDIKASNILLSNVKVSKGSCNQVPRFTAMRTCRIQKTARFTRNLRPHSNINYLDDIPDFEQIVSLNVKTDKRLQNRTKDQVYLLDYGLASKFLTSCGKHKPFCVDERRAHAGTILFCSRDAHKGVPSRRSDLESLGYNMIYWLTGNLPWSNDIDNPEIVDKKKQKSMTDIEYFLYSCFSFTEYPQVLLDYFKYIQRLEFEEKPDYGYCKRLFKQSMKENGYKDDSVFDFDNVETSTVKQKSENVKMRKFIPKISRRPLQSNIPVKPSLRKKVKNKKMKKRANWFEVMDPEVILKQAREKKNTENNDTALITNTVVDMNINRLNPTYAMIEVYNKCRERVDASPTYKGDSCLENVNGYTHAMMSVLEKIKKRKELEVEHLAVNLNRNGKIMKRCNSKRKRKLESPAKSPPQTRTTKSLTDLKKEQFQSRKIKHFAVRRTYSLRG